MEPSDTDSSLDVSVLIRDTTWSEENPTIEKTCIDAAHAAFSSTRSNASEQSEQTYEASIVLADDDFVADLNLKYRERSGPTNVLSFAATDFDADDSPPQQDGLPVLLGDVVIARGVVVREASEMETPLNDHLRHMVVHGILHLLGYDHLVEDEAEEMEGLETVILASMGVQDPYDN